MPVPCLPLSTHCFAHPDVAASTPTSAGWSKAGKARTENHGLMGVFEREFWTNTPGELALVWDYKGEGVKDSEKAKKK